MAMVGNSIEVEAPTPERADTSAAASEPQAAPVDVKSLPPEPTPLSVDPGSGAPARELRAGGPELKE